MKAFTQLLAGLMLLLLFLALRTCLFGAAVKLDAGASAALAGWAPGPPAPCDASSGGDQECRIS